MRLKLGINIYLIASKYLCSLSEWAKIQYQWWMLNTNYCVQDEKYFQKQACIVLFFVYTRFGEEKKRQNLQITLSNYEI